MSLARCKEETPITDFYLWLAKFDAELDEVTREEHYLANIAMEIRRTINPKKRLDPNKFIIKFVRKGRQKNKPHQGETHAEMLKRVRISQQRLGLAIGAPPPP